MSPFFLLAKFLRIMSEGIIHKVSRFRELLAFLDFNNTQQGDHQKLTLK